MGKNLKVTNISFKHNQFGRQNHYYLKTTKYLKINSTFLKSTLTAFVSLTQLLRTTHNICKV